MRFLVLFTPKGVVLQCMMLRCITCCCVVLYGVFSIFWLFAAFLGVCDVVLHSMTLFGIGRSCFALYGVVLHYMVGF